MGKKEVLGILDEVNRTYRGEYTELMTHLMKDMVEEIYEVAEECRVDDVLTRMVAYGNLWGRFLFELPERGFEVTGPPKGGGHSRHVIEHKAENGRGYSGNL
jgi:hypothetical protein